jgi:hypothetical protein
LYGIFIEVFSIELSTDTNLLNFMGDNSSSNNNNNTNTNTNNNNNNNNNNTASNNSSSSAAEHGNSVLMGIGISAGFKLAQSQPTIAGKVGAVAGGIAVGSGAILAKIVSQNISKNFGKFLMPYIYKSYTSFNYYEFIELSGNDGLDLLNIILKFNGISIIILLMIIYNYMLSKTDIEYISKIISQYLPSKYVNFIIRILTKIQQSNNILIILLFAILLASLLLSYYYLDFFINNIDQIIEIYFKKK